MSLLQKGATRNVTPEPTRTRAFFDRSIGRGADRDTICFFVLAHRKPHEPIRLVMAATNLLSSQAEAGQTGVKLAYSDLVSQSHALQAEPVLQVGPPEQEISTCNFVFIFGQARLHFL